MHTSLFAVVVETPFQRIKSTKNVLTVHPKKVHEASSRSGFPVGIFFVWDFKVSTSSMHRAQ